MRKAIVAVVLFTSYTLQGCGVDKSGRAAPATATSAKLAPAARAVRIPPASAKEVPDAPPKPAEAAQSEPSGMALLIALYMLDTRPGLTAQSPGEGEVTITHGSNVPEPKRWHPCRVDETNAPPELPATLAALAAEQAKRLKTKEAVQKAWEEAGENREAAWHAALAYEYLDQEKPPLNPGLIILAEGEGRLTAQQCQELLPYLRGARGYKLQLDRKRKQRGEEHQWINTPHWAHTCWAIKGCEETVREAQGERRAQPTAQ